MEGARDPRVIAKIREHIEPPPERRYGQPRYLRTFADGTIFGLAGQEYFLVRDGEIEFRRIPVEAPPTGIFLLRLDTDGNIVRREQFELGQYPEHPAVSGDKLFLALQDTRDNRQYLRIYREETLELIDTLEIGERGTKPTFENTICSMGKYDEHTLIMFVGQEARLVDAESCEILQRRELPAAVKIYAMTSDKSIYVPNKSELIRFRFDD